MKRTATTLLGVAALSITTQAANIAWVSFHSADNTPSAGAAGAGMSTAADIGYTSFLAANGHTVTRFLSKDNPTAADATTYNSYDLIIVSRSAASGHYQQINEVGFWNRDVTKPVLHMGGYAIRNVRLGFTTGGTIPDTTTAIGLQALVPSHPVFAGIALDGANNMVNSFAGIATFGTTTQRGISVNTDPIAGTGTIIAKIGTADPANSGTGMIIGEWAAGSTLNVTNVLPAARMVFLTGSREAAGVNSETAGIFDLTPDGSAMLLNAVNYLVPEPSTYALLGIGALALVFRLRRK